MVVENWPSLGPAESVTKAELAAAKKEAEKAASEGLGGETAAREAADAAEKIAREASEKGLIRPVFNVKTDYGAKGDNATDDNVAIQNAINAASEAGGGVVFLPLGIYLTSKALQLKTNVTLLGDGTGATVLKLKNGSAKETYVLQAFNAGAGGQDNYCVMDLTIDGNKANNAEGGGGFRSDGRQCLIYNVRVRNCHDVGLSHSQSAVDLPASEGGQESYISNFRIYNGDDNGLAVNAHDTKVIQGQCVGNKIANFRCTSAVEVVNVHCWGASEYGFDISGGNSAFVNCFSEGASKAMVRVNSDTNTWVGGQIFRAGEPLNVPGILWEVGKGLNCQFKDVLFHDLGEPGALKFTGNGEGSTITGFLYGSATPLWTGAPHVTVDFSGVRVGAAATRALRTVASANNLVVPIDPIVEVTGVTEIKKITAPLTAPHRVLLKFKEVLKVVDGENLKLAGNFETTADDTLELAFDGTNYYEVGRSVN